LFVVKRALVALVVSLPMAALAIASRQGLVALVVLAIPIFMARIRYRFSVAVDGLRVRWACFEQRLGFDSIESVALAPDPRRGALGSRLPMLAIHRKHARPLLLVAPVSELEVLQAALASQLHGSGA
jgi:hypothetical protein